jgi:protein-tyrosine phosphatase
VDVYRVCFVCLGNICRSPIAETVMRSLLGDAGLDGAVEVSSAGTGDWHVGEGADERALDVLTRNNYDASGHRAQQFVADMFTERDLVVAMDRTNAAALRRLAPPGESGKIRLLRSFDPDADADDVPDPYYGGPGGFDDVLTMVDAACRGLLTWLEQEMRS